MSEIKINKKKVSGLAVRKAFEFYYKERYFNIWMNMFKFTGLNYQQVNYIMKKMWAEGTIAASRPVGIPNNLGIDLGEDSIVFTPYAPTNVYNIYDYPTEALPINTRGVKFISTKPLKIDEEIVLIYCQRNKKSVLSSIEAKINQIIDLEMVIRVATKGQKMPWLFTTTPENKNAIKELVQGLENDDPILFTSLEENEKSNALINGSPYVLDKLEQMRQKLDNDILTFLGKNNVGIAEKKEHLIVDEVNANNQEIESNGNDFEVILNEGFERCGKVFGQQIKCELAHELKYNDYREEEDDDESFNEE